MTTTIIKVQIFSSLYDKFIQIKESFDAYEKYIITSRTIYDNELSKFREAKNRYHDYVENEISHFVYDNDISDDNLYTFLKLRKHMNHIIVGYGNNMNKYNNNVIEILEKNRDEHKKYLDDLKEIIIKYPPKKGNSATTQLSRNETNIVNKFNDLVLFDIQMQKNKNYFDNIPSFDTSVFDDQLNVLSKMKNLMYQDKMKKIDIRIQTCRKRKNS